MILHATFYSYFKKSSVANTKCTSSFRYTHMITCRKLRLNKLGDWQRPTAEMKCDTEQTMKLEWLYKVRSECELSSWPDSSVCHSVWTWFSGWGFKSFSDQLSIATSKNLSVVNTICISWFSNTHVITYRKVWLHKCGDWLRQTTEKIRDTEQNNDIGVPVQSWLWVRAEFMVW